MSTEIRAWQIADGKLQLIETTMPEVGRWERELEKWLARSSDLLGEDIAIIGEQVRTKSGKADFLGVDTQGNVVVIELKRDRLEREVVAQAIDYASDIASWDGEKLDSICRDFRKKGIEEYLATLSAFEETESFPSTENIRILLVGFGLGDATERMISWLSGTFEVPINAVLIKYIRTSSNEEILVRTTIIPEDVDIERAAGRRYRKQPRLDEPGNYSDEELELRLRSYFQGAKPTVTRVLLPLCLEASDGVSREAVVDKLMKTQPERYPDKGSAGLAVAGATGVFSLPKYSALRQVLGYEVEWGYKKTNFRVDERYKPLLRKLLTELPNAQPS